MSLWIELPDNLFQLPKRGSRRYRSFCSPSQSSFSFMNSLVADKPYIADLVDFLSVQVIQPDEEWIHNTIFDGQRVHIPPTTPSPNSSSPSSSPPPPQTTSFTFPNEIIIHTESNSYPFVTEVGFTEPTKVLSIHFESSSFERTMQLSIDSFPKLQKLEIGSYCFQGYLQGLHPSQDDHLSYVFCVRNCPSLQTIKVGEHSLTHGTDIVIESRWFYFTLLTLLLLLLPFIFSLWSIIVIIINKNKK